MSWWRWMAGVAVAATFGGCGESSVPFRFEVHLYAEPEWGDGVYWEVTTSEANASTIRRDNRGLADAAQRPDLWVKMYPSHRAALDALRSDPLRVDCWTAQGSSCGTATVDTVCEWAIDLLEPSPIVRGEIHVGFHADGQVQVSDSGICYAEDGSTAHGDGPGPDAGSSPDAAISPPDAGAPPPDAGIPDASTPDA